MGNPTQSFFNPEHQQHLLLLKIFTIYRVAVAIVLLIFFLFEPFDTVSFGSRRYDLFFYGVSTYLALNLVTLIIVLPKSRQLRNQQLFVTFFLDAAVIIFLMDTSGGVGGTLDLLLVVTVAAASIMLPAQLATLLAALASLGVLTDTIMLIRQNDIHSSTLLNAGLIGIILFITAFIIQSLSSRIRGTQLLAEQRAQDISRLQRLNQQIVQRMRTGILVCSQSGKILLANSAAGELLGDESLSQATGSSPKQMPDLLMDQLNQWNDTPQFRRPPFHVQESDRELLVNFSSIAEDVEADTLIFLEDNRRLVQQAQQMKLVSLGRLTASIAHEIRNPLSAISHAAQLLVESDDINPADHRLCDIIQNHSLRMNKVIENVLQLSSRNAPNPERIRLEVWLKQFIDEFEFIGSSHWTIALETENSDLEASIDSSQLNQVITNLCQNGLRYSQQQTGEATLLLKLFQHPVTHLAVLDIIDFGPGVSEEAIDHIFEPFYTTDPKGSGLGLYISRELCEANEARLDYIKNEDGESCFRISFPHPDRRLRPE